MTRRICDVCGKEVEQYGGLSNLTTKYQMDGIQELCKECDYQVNDFILKISNAFEPLKTSWIKKFILKLKGGKK